MMRFTTALACVTLHLACTATDFEPIAQAPLLENPDSQAVITTDSVTLRWQTAPGAASYEVFIDGVLHERTTSLHSDVALTPRPDPYCWSVIGVDDLMKNPSVRRCFNVVGPSPVLRSPIDGLSACNADRLTFTWDVVPNATAYQLDVFGENSQTVGGSPIQTSETSQTLPEVLPAGLYRWTVSPIFGDHVGAPAIPFHFAQLGQIEEPQGVQLPEDGLTPFDDVLSWTGDADEFEVDLRQGGCEGASVSGWPKKTTDSNVSTGVLDEAGKYGFRVRGIRGQCYSDWVCAESFEVEQRLCGEPIDVLEWHDVTPANLTTNLTEPAGEVSPITRQLFIVERDTTLQLDLSIPLSPVLTNITASAGPIVSGVPQWWWHAESGLRYDPINERMIIYSPENSLSQATYTLTTNPIGTWTQLSTGAQVPPDLGEYGAAFDAKRNRYLVVGGVANSDVWSLDFDSSPPEWSILTTTGDNPGSLLGIQANIVSPLDVLVTGFGSDGLQANSDIYVLDLETLVWTRRLPSGPIPKARLEYGGDVCECRFVIAGPGSTNILTATQADHLAIYDVGTNTWESPTILGTFPDPEIGTDGAWDPVSRTLYVYGRFGGPVPTLAGVQLKIYALTGL